MKSWIAITFLVALGSMALLVSAQKHECTGSNEVFTACGSMCPRTCLNRNLMYPCLDMCKVNVCICKPGFIRVGVDGSGGNGDCIDEAKCDATIESMRRHD